MDLCPVGMGEGTNPGKDSVRLYGFMVFGCIGGRITPGAVIESRATTKWADN